SGGADGGNEAVFAHCPYLRRPRQRGAFLAGAADPAHRSGVALARLNSFGRAREPKWPVEARRQCLLWGHSRRTPMIMADTRCPLRPACDETAWHRNMSQRARSRTHARGLCSQTDLQTTTEGTFDVMRFTRSTTCSSSYSGIPAIRKISTILSVTLGSR